MTQVEIILCIILVILGFIVGALFVNAGLQPLPYSCGLDCPVFGDGAL